MSSLLSGAILQTAKVAKVTDKVFKDECLFSFDTPYSTTGLYVSLTTFKSFGEDYVGEDFRRNGNRLYLHLKKVLKEKAVEENLNQPPEKKPKQLAIGTEDGFNPETLSKEYEDCNSLVIFPEREFIPLPNNDLPYSIIESINSILKAESALSKAEVAAWVLEKRKISSFAENLKQERGIKIPPKGWKCARCDITENLWLNLTDGTILCSRKNWDGSGGNGHALEHYNQTKFPLCVKLGTISSEGNADVYSYAEDDMVEDPKLKEHLLNFGIDMDGMLKTEKTMTEMEIDQNMTYEFNRIQESGKEGTLLSGPGFTGISNIGNSCYLASVMQVAFTIPDFIQRFYDHVHEIFSKVGDDPSSDLNVQLAKFGSGLLSGKYSKVDEKDAFDGISPRMFKSLIGKGHPEFSTMKQQDASEFFQYFLQAIDRLEKSLAHPKSPSSCFKFVIEDKIECNSSHMVKYTKKTENIYTLPIPLDKSINKDAFRQYEALSAEEKKNSKIVRPIIPLSECLKLSVEPELVENFYSTATKSRGTATKKSGILSFPKYLVFQMRRFTVGDDWVPKKLDVDIEVPETIDLEWMRATPHQEGEALLPEEKEEKEPKLQPEFIINQEILENLISMGFDPEGCKKAVYHTKNTGIEPAMNWVLEHMDDIDFSTPFVPPSSTKSKKEEPVNEESIMMLESMGFSRAQSIKALKNTNNNLERAADWLFSRGDKLDDDDNVEVNPPSVTSGSEGEITEGGNSKYRLLAFISHMGSNTNCGHYVAHIKKNGQWAMFNDSKVTTSQDPPKEMGYMYFFERIDE